MNTRSRWAAALIACFCLVNTESVQAQLPRNPFAPSYAAERAEVPYASYNSFENSYGYELDDYGGEGYDGCGGGICEVGCPDQGGGIPCRSGQFFIGADYLNVRSTFSEATAFVTSIGGTPNSGSLLLPPVTNTFHELEYDYESSYRIFGGYRLCGCGEEVRFAFTRFNSSADAYSGPVPVASGGQSTQIVAPGELVVVNVGDSISTTSVVDAKIYDLSYAKTIPLGLPASCGSTCDDVCCDTGSVCCPAWDIKWSAGVRFASVDWDRQAVRDSLTPAIDGDYDSTTMNFDGGGPRIGLEGTRYLGCRQHFAVFARSDLSLLLGTVEIEHIGDSAASMGLDRVTRFNTTQLIPVLDIEAGGTVFVTDRLEISAGYLFSAWHDLGMRDTFDILDGRGPTFDDANILGFDGFFARAEFNY